MIRAAALLFLSAVSFCLAQNVQSKTLNSVAPSAIIHEINLARQNPALYAGFLEQKHMSGPSLGRAGSASSPSRALEEAIGFLRTAQPQPPLSLSPGLCQAAADHCRNQAGGAIGHNGTDRSSPSRRISRYGTWQRGWAENIAYGRRSARDIVLAWIIDAGFPGRGHRRNIFNSSFTVAGAAYGPHARFGTMCNIDFAGAFLENAYVSAGTPGAAF